MLTLQLSYNFPHRISLRRWAGICWTVLDHPLTLSIGVDVLFWIPSLLVSSSPVTDSLLIAKIVRVFCAGNSCQEIKSQQSCMICQDSSRHTIQSHMIGSNFVPEGCGKFGRRCCWWNVQTTVGRCHDTNWSDLDSAFWNKRQLRWTASHVCQRWPSVGTASREHQEVSQTPTSHSSQCPQLTSSGSCPDHKRKPHLQGYL